MFYLRYLRCDFCWNAIFFCIFFLAIISFSSAQNSVKSRELGIWPQGKNLKTQSDLSVRNDDDSDKSGHNKTSQNAGQKADSRIDHKTDHKTDQKTDLMGGWGDWTFLHKDEVPTQKFIDDSNGGYLHFENGKDRHWMFFSPWFSVDRSAPVLYALANVRCHEGNLIFRIFGRNGRDITKGKFIADLQAKDNPVLEDLFSVLENKFEMIQFVLSGPGKISADFRSIRLMSSETVSNETLPKIEGYAKVKIEEKLNRGLVALPCEKGAYLGWRLLNTDSDGVGFDVYRKGNDEQNYKKLNEKPIILTTDFIDQTAKPGQSYLYRVQKCESGKNVRTVNKNLQNGSKNSQNVSKKLQNVSKNSEAVGPDSEDLQIGKAKLSMTRKGEAFRQYVSIPL